MISSSLSPSLPCSLSSLPFCTILLKTFTYLKETESNCKKRQRAPFYWFTFPKCPQELKLDQTKSQELGSHSGGRNPVTWPFRSYYGEWTSGGSWNQKHICVSNSGMLIQNPSIPSDILTTMPNAWSCIHFFLSHADILWQSTHRRCTWKQCGQARGKEKLTHSAIVTEFSANWMEDSNLDGLRLAWI